MSKNSDFKNAVRKTKEWKEFRRHLIEKQKVSFISGKKLTKGACGRLEQLKAEHYLSNRAACIISHDIDSYFTAETAEGYFQAMFFSKKMESPYRPNNSYGTRDLCDECYRLNDTDIEAIKKTLSNIKISRYK